VRGTKGWRRVKDGSCEPRPPAVSASNRLPQALPAAHAGNPSLTSIPDPSPIARACLLHINKQQGTTQMIAITEKTYNGWRDTRFEGSPEEVVLQVAELLIAHVDDPLEVRPMITEIDRCRRVALQIVVTERTDDPNQLNLI
jgi:hypothetical protein